MEIACSMSAVESAGVCSTIHIVGATACVRARHWSRHLTIGVSLLLMLGTTLTGGAAFGQDSPKDAPSAAKTGAVKAKRASHGPVSRDFGVDEGGQANAAPAVPTVPAALAAGRICTIDRTVILSTANINVASAQRLIQLRQNAQNELVEAAKAADAEAKALDADKRPPGDEGFRKAREGLAERRHSISSRVALLPRELDATLQSVNGQIATAAGPILQAVEKAQGCSLLLSRESVIDGVGTVDVTQAVLRQMDAQLQPRPFDLVQIDQPPHP